MGFESTLIDLAKWCSKQFSDPDEAYRIFEVITKFLRACDESEREYYLNLSWWQIHDAAMDK